MLQTPGLTEAGFAEGLALKLQAHPVLPVNP